MKEIYINFEDKYYISNLGNIKNIKSNKILKKIINHNGYYKVTISINGKLKTVFPHRLVAKMFIPNPNNLPQINHKDENKLNNRINNLEWCDCKYNANYGSAIKRRTKKQRKKILIVDELNDRNFVFKSLTDASSFLNCNVGMITKVCKRKNNKYKNYIIKYYNEA